MPTYVYRCPQDGDFDLRASLGAAPPTVACGRCAAVAVRVWSAPHLTGVPRGVTAAVDAAGRSAETPTVVDRVPGTRRSTPTRVPRGLPRL